MQTNVVLLIVAVILIILGIKSLRKYYFQSNWTKNDGIIKSINEIEEEVFLTPTVSQKFFYPSIEYEYSLEGSLYTNNVVAFEKENIWVSETNNYGDPTPMEERWWKSFKSGDEIKVYINPKDEKDSVIVKDISKNRRSHHLALIIGGLLLLVLWGFINAAT